MRIFISIYVLLVSFSSIAENDLEVMLKEHNFLGRYTHQLYIKDDVLIYIDEHWPKDSNVQTFKLPQVSSKTLTKDDQRKLIKKIKELGVESWKPEYPEPREDVTQICDGLSFVLYIKAKGLDIRTVGACETPENYGEVSKLLGLN